MKTLLIIHALLTGQCVSPPHLPHEAPLSQCYTKPDEVHTLPTSSSGEPRVQAIGNHVQKPGSLPNQRQGTM